MTGSELRKKLEHSGISLTELAEKLNITPQALNSRLNAKEIKFSFILDLSEATKEPVTYFYNDLQEFSESMNSIKKSQSDDKGNRSTQSQQRKILELEARLKDKEETIEALKKLVDLYERREQNKG
ncbi:helix-turn-helix transcriptional regulator [Spirosoma sp. SC4-14]|uniref:helix-turn-helix domain-containing protein n=1 Tax=Spirosoma sp. SC4-14 TaxID=3128900 RepID=UPI0030CD7200